jgi:histidine triad (HIT) family protein
MTCLFCKMIQGDIPVTKIYEDDSCICIRDINPQAKIHLLIIPKQHIESLAAAFPEQGVALASLMGSLLEKATLIARQQGLLPGGFRTVINTDENGGQTVFHLHFHILGGERLRGSFA